MQLLRFFGIILTFFIFHQILMRLFVSKLCWELLVVHVSYGNIYALHVSQIGMWDFYGKEASCKWIEI